MSSQQDLTNSLIGAMETVFKGRAQQMRFDQTISCEITAITNPATGEYRVRYLNDTFLNSTVPFRSFILVVRCPSFMLILVFNTSFILFADT